MRAGDVHDVADDLVCSSAQLARHPHLVHAPLAGDEQLADRLTALHLLATQVLLDLGLALVAGHGDAAGAAGAARRELTAAGDAAVAARLRHRRYAARAPPPTVAGAPGRAGCRTCRAWTCRSERRQRLRACRLGRTGLGGPALVAPPSLAGAGRCAPRAGRPGCLVSSVSSICPCASTMTATAQHGDAFLAPEGAQSFGTSALHGDRCTGGFAEPLLHRRPVGCQLRRLAHDRTVDVTDREPRFAHQCARRGAAIRASRHPSTAGRCRGSARRCRPIRRRRAARR